MATTYWELIDNVTADNPERLKEKIWLKYEGHFESPDIGRPMQLQEDWKFYEFDMLENSPMPRVIVFRPPPGKTSFGSVRIVEDGRQEGILWDVFNSKDFPAVGVYTGVIPPGFVCHLVGVELKTFQDPD